MSQSENFLSGNETEIEDIGGGLKRQMLGYNHELMGHWLQPYPPTLSSNLCC